jgi:putative transposase
MKALRAPKTVYTETLLGNHHKKHLPTRREDEQMTYWRLHYHLIWATFERQPSITPERERMIYRVIYRKADELGLKVHAAGNVGDHIHVVVSIPPKLAVAECIKHFKGSSAYAVNHIASSDGTFKWQEGYGALSIGEGSLEKVKAYAARQKEHHHDKSLVELYEKMDES